MKHVPFVLVLLVVGLLVGCAPAVSQAGSGAAPGENELDSEAALDRSGDTPTPLVPLTPTNIPTAEQTVAATPLATPTPIDAPASTDTPAPNSTPTTESNATAELASPTDNAVSEELIAYGLQVYKQQYCGICHQLDFANTAGMLGPTQNDMGTIAEQRIEDSRYTGQATTAAGYIRESIVDPAAYYVEGYEQSRHHMPAVTHLSEAELDALVQMLLQQK